MPTYAIGEVDSGAGITFRGGARELWRCKAHEVMIAGPSETGKTFSALHKLDTLLWKYPGSQAVIIRKTLSSLYTSVLKTFKNVIGFGADRQAVQFYGGEKPEWADYPNRSRVFFAGMDNPQKALSSERDFIYVNQAEELAIGDWETLTTRCTGRAANAPYSQILGDCNPGPPTHWILHRPSLKVFQSRHEDNPTLFDDEGQITDRGRKTLEILDRLTGVRKARLRHGQWVQGEGVVYEGYDRAIHLIEPHQIPKCQRFIRSIDFGYTNPFVCSWWAIDFDGRMYLYREIYMSGRTVAVHARKIRELSGGERYEATVADHDAEDRATLAAEGIATTPAYKAISRGIQAVEDRIKVAGDGRPRIFVSSAALVERDESLATLGKPTSTAEEFEVYSWPKGQDGRPVKETPVDSDNHGMDQMRYAVAYVDGLRPQESGPLKRDPSPLAGHRGGGRLSDTNVVGSLAGRGRR